MTRKTIKITKASGEIVPFSDKKLEQSMARAGASAEMIKSVITNLHPQLYEGIPTKKIYRLAFAQLKKQSKKIAGKYHLKQGIMELGPAGFHFEKLVGELLKHQGYSVKIGEIVTGHCVNHEIDIIAEKENHHFMVECKYHNLAGIACDVKIPLYIYARFKDVEQTWIKIPGHGGKFHQAWIATNTKFTVDAVKYGTCMGMNLIGWNFPDKGNLRNLIEQSRLYPITCITSLSKYEKQQLLDSGILLCKQLNNKVFLENIGIKGDRTNRIMGECYNLLNGIRT